MKQYCDHCCLEIAAGRCGCTSWEEYHGGYMRVTPPHPTITQLAHDQPTMPHVVLGRLLRRLASITTL